MEVLKVDELGSNKKLICMVGIPYSGKSTKARTYNAPVVNPDSIRVALHGRKFISSAEPFVWAITRIMIKALFFAGHDVVVLDATNTTRKRRKDWVSKDWETVFDCINNDITVCLERADRAGDIDIVPVISKMFDEYEPVDELLGY